MKWPLYTKVRLLFHLEKDPYFRFFYSLLGFVPKNLSLYKLALRHRSNQSEHNCGNALSNNNERLEFLGDAILEAVVTDVLYHHFPNKMEGFLSNTRAKIVQRETMNKIALEMGLGRFLSVSQNVAASSTNVYGNALEAVIGAIYLDQGYKTTICFIKNRLFKSYINLSEVAGEEFNFKSHLIEWGQKKKIGVSFSSIDITEAIGKTPEFKTEVIIGGKVAGTGTGGTKKESQQRAAEVAIEKIKTNRELKEYISHIESNSADNHPFGTKEGLNM